MATDNSKLIYLVFSADDGQEWSSYLVELLSEVGLQVRCVELDSSGLLPPSFSKFRRGRVVLLLASPGFLNSLLAGEPNSLDALVNQQPAMTGDASVLVVVFLCGTLMIDFDELDSRDRPLSERFPGLSRWTVVDHDGLRQLPRTVCSLVERVRTDVVTEPAAKKLAPTTYVDATQPKSTTSGPKRLPKPRHKTLHFRLLPEEVRCEVAYSIFHFSYLSPNSTWLITSRLDTTRHV